MDAIKHTPGPWVVLPGFCQRGKWLGHREIRSGARGATVTMQPKGSRDEVDEANARLIAAAPDMFETERKLANEVGGLKAFEAEIRAIIGNTNWSVLMQRLDDADAAIAKAEGRS